MAVDNPRIFIVDDDAAVRESLTWLLGAEGFDTEPYASAHDFIENADVLDGECALVDMRMPETSGLELLTQIVVRFPQLPVVMISGHGNVRTAVKSIKIGAWDFIEKPIDNNVILKTVRGAIAESVNGRHTAPAIEKFKASIMALTPREKEVYELVVAGKTSPEIAKLLHISVRTVSAHRASIKVKTGTTSMAHLVRLSVQMGE